jgi:hypothetical protein
LLSASFAALAIGQDSHPPAGARQRIQEMVIGWDKIDVDKGSHSPARALPWIKALEIKKGMSKADVDKYIFSVATTTFYYGTYYGKSRTGSYSLDSLWEVEVKFTNDKVTSFRVCPSKQRGRGDFFDLRDRIGDDDLESVFAIHQVSHLDGDAFDPTALIRAVNRLRSVGKYAATAAIINYLTLCDSDRDQCFKYDLHRQKILLILSLLFEAKEGERARAKYFENADRVPPATGLPKGWETFPLVLSDDVPFMLCAGFGGVREPRKKGDDEGRIINTAGSGRLGIRHHLAYCLQHCELRATDLSPKASASAAYAKLVETPAMKDFSRPTPRNTSRLRRSFVSR